eukprot:12212159-Karenia_brevis.AAC.2
MSILSLWAVEEGVLQHSDTIAHVLCARLPKISSYLVHHVLTGAWLVLHNTRKALQPLCLLRVVRLSSRNIEEDRSLLYLKMYGIVDCEHCKVVNT